MFVKTEKTYDDDEPHHRIGDGKYGEVPKRPKGALSKSARWLIAMRGFKSHPRRQAFISLSLFLDLLLTAFSKG